MQLALRVACESDANEIASLVNRAYRPESHEGGWTHEAELVSGSRTSAEKVLSLFGHQSCILLLCSGPVIIACVHVQHNESGAHIGMLATDPLYQTQGLGKQLLSNAEAYALEQFSAALLQIAVLSSRHELISFYERRGYVRTGKMEDYPLSADVGVPKHPGLKIEILEKMTANPSINTDASDKAAGAGYVKR